jgi:hypothetical protein
MAVRHDSGMRALVTGGPAPRRRAGGGLYWVVPAVLAAIVFGLINAWVLLIEILR